MSTFPGVFSLTGEIAIITGGGTGIGFGTARAFAEAGARVVLVGRRVEILEQAAREIGHGTTFEPHDVTDTATAADFMARIASRAGPPAILVNNAGIHLKKAAVETSDAEFNTVMNAHVTASFSMTRAVAPYMMERERGNILFMASMASLMGIPKVVAYTAAKSAYVGLVRSLAVELGPHGIRVNAIAPGWIESPMLHKAMESDPRRKTRVLERTPMARLGRPEEIGWAAVYLCSPAASFVNGVVLPVDGGAAIGF